MKLKYIRTKDSICKTDYHNKEQHYYITTDYEDYKDSEVKIGDTIEELVDCFVYSDEVFKNVIYNNFHALKILLKLRKNYVVYGAIWTDKGLMFIAKMNEEGELELL